LSDLWPVNTDESGISVMGLLGGPSLTRSNSSGLYTYINGRFIRDKVVQHAIIQAYRGVIDKGRYPVLVLFMEIPLPEVDINVHPTKHEVRFREQGKVHDHILAALGDVLGRSPWIVRTGKQHIQNHYVDVDPVKERLSGVKDALARYSSSGEKQIPVFTAVSASAPKIAEWPKTSAEPEAMIAANPGYYSSISIIGQYKTMYILCQDGADLVLIDQHAAHERIAFQRLRGEYARSGLESQALLFPETFELTYGESATLSEHAEEVEKLGFEIENFGGNTHVIKAVPRLIATTGYLSALRDILSELDQLSRSDKVDQMLDGLLARIACHSVVRGNHSLTLPEIKALLKQMDETEFSGTCPHGRPVLVKITLSEIEKMFKRSKSVSGE
jgi:DNA mismatch repair protein MutL